VGARRSVRLRDEIAGDFRSMAAVERVRSRPHQKKRSAPPAPSGEACDSLTEKQRSAAAHAGSLAKTPFLYGEMSQFPQNGRVVQVLVELLVRSDRFSNDTVRRTADCRR
jgi:hypothetical protein